MVDAQSNISFPTPPLQLAQGLVAWLNRSRVPAVFTATNPFWSAKAIRKRLRGYTDSWIAADCVLSRWAMREQLQKTVHYATLDLTQTNSKSVRTVINWQLPLLDNVSTGAGDDYVPPTEATTEADAEEQERIEDEIREWEWQKRAAEIFLAFITGPYYNRIGRCARCSRYFLNTSGHRNKRFCSARCARIESAVKSKRERDQRDYQQRLKRVQKAAARFLKLSAARQREIDDLTAWISKEAGVTRHVVTRAVNKGLLKGVSK
jgi:hypothetical protein